MRKVQTRNRTVGGHARERGAALVTMLLTSTLLLAAGGALILTTSMGTGTAADSTAEMQAYYIAESGLQSALNVLRGHARPLAASGLNPDTDRITFRNAVVPNKSNGQTSNAPPYMLTAWLSYNNTNTVPVSIQVGATTLTGGYRIQIQDPDNSHVVTFSTSTSLGTGTTPLGSGASLLNISFQAGGATFQPADLNTLPYTFATNFGQFSIQRPSASTATLAANTELPFTLTINQTVPWSASAQYTGRLRVISAATIRLMFDNSPTRKADGTTYTLANTTVDLAYPAANSTTTTQLTATVGAPDPKRLVVRSIGFGPRQSRRQLEMILNRSNFEFEAPATLTMQGAGDCSPMTLDTGSSGAKDYSGHDLNNPTDQRPAIAVPPCDVQEADDGIKKHDTVANPEIGVLGNGTPTAGTTTTEPTTPVGTPSFLQSADAARDYLNSLEATARSQGRYFKPAAGTSRTVNDGTSTNPAFTFVDGDCELEGGAGILVVTGNLNMSGNPDFDGIILVLGEGSVNRNGGGDGNIYGALVVAAFDRTWPADENNQPHPFLAPVFNTNGGGNSNLQYSSLAISRAFAALGSSVAGVREF